MSPRSAAAGGAGVGRSVPGVRRGERGIAPGSPADGCCEIRKRKAQALGDHRPSCFHGGFFLNIYQYLLSSRESLYLWMGQRKEFHFLGGLDSSCQHRRVRQGQRLGLQPHGKRGGDGCCGRKRVLLSGSIPGTAAGAAPAQPFMHSGCSAAFLVENLCTF